MQAEAGFDVACPGFSLDKIQVAQVVDYGGGDDILIGGTTSFGDRRVPLVATITNTNDVTVTLNVQWELTKTVNVSAAATQNVGSYSVTLGPNVSETIRRLDHSSTAIWFNTATSAPPHRR